MSWSDQSGLPPSSVQLAFFVYREMDRKRQPSNYPVTPAAMSQSRFLDPASALFAAKRRPRSRNVSTVRSCRKCRCQEGALASWRRSETATPKLKGRRSVGPALVGCLHLGLSLGSFCSIACNYAGLRGEGSTPVPLPPPPWSKPHIIRVSLWAIKPNSGGDFSFELRTPSWQGALIIL